MLKTQAGQSMKTSNKKLKHQIIHALEQAIDPEVGMNVLEVRLIQNLKTDNGIVRLTFTPTSPICPLAFQLGIDIKKAIEKVEEVEKIMMDVDGYIDNAKLKSAIDNA